MKKIMICAALVFAFIVACEKKQDTAAEKQTEASAVEEHRCANCGMVTNKYPKWEQKVTSADKEDMYFDGARCMFKVLLDSSASPQQVEQILVKDYYTLKYIDGRTAFYVIGSDVLGPMGNELIPFEDEAAAGEFKTDHKGEQIIRFEDVDMMLVKKLAGKMTM